jgi:hypothetical protein
MRYDTARRFDSDKFITVKPTLDIEDRTGAGASSDDDR